MQVTLVFPPSWIPSQPFSSLPSLQAFLRKEGVDNVTIRDLNIEVMDTLLSGQKVEETYAGLDERLRGGKKSFRNGVNELEELTRLRWAKEVIEGEDMIHMVEWAKGTLRSEGFYNIEDYVESWKIIDRWLQAYGKLYYPAEITVADNFMGYSVYSSSDILAATNDAHKNPYYDLFKGYILDSIVKDEPSLVGISVTATSQVIPAFTLARLLREKSRGTHITIGGSVFTKLIDNLQGPHMLFELVDSFVVFEGEHALLALIEQLEGKKGFSKVPNLIYKKDGQTRLHEPFYIENINSLPTPEYDGFPLELYLSPKRVLPLQGSRGCYWGKCTFCNLHVDHLRFRLRDVDLVLEDITKVKEEYQTKYLFFSDECMPVKQLDSLSSRLIDDGIEIRWMAGTRFDTGFTKGVIKKARDAGCLKMVFGLESSNRRILSLMQKGIETDTAKNAIGYCLDSAIAIHLYIIVGFPSETKEEALETLDFIISNDRLMKSRGVSCLPCLFELEKHAPIMQDPGRYGLTSIAHPKGDDMSLGYFYEVNTGMSPDEASDIYRYIKGEIDKKLSIFPYNFSMSDGLLYLDHFSEEDRENMGKDTHSEIVATKMNGVAK
ncbi:MAG: radical SAM protein [Thermodesulfobacteriota bacterium]